MKTRELTADEIKISLSEQDISMIQPESTPNFPPESIADTAIKTAFRIRGKGMNLFVCGPSAPEREEAVLNAASSIQTGRRTELVICENPAAPFRPVIRKGGPGSVDGLKTAVLVSSAETPVIIENNPVPQKLFGRSSSEIDKVTAGSILESSGGILVINAEDLLDEEDSWKLLKRVLRSGKITIGSGSSEPRNSLLLPEIGVDIKLVILGSEGHYDHFYNTDEDFRELFGFFAELDSVADLNDSNIAALVNRCRNFSTERLGCRLTDDAALEIIKFSVASAENNTKLSTLTSETEILLIEAAEICRTGSETVQEYELNADDIKSAIKHQADRFSLLEKRIIEDIKSGEINLAVDGYETGKVNGLAIIDKGPWSFGFPGLISARIAAGENGLVNIEHEAGLSGEIHDKWVLILEGFLRSKFAADFPISIFASICFEQSYSEIDGDSASSSELYALLSAIAGVPLRQDIAVTGSLSQTGEIQAVGGLREKIEGFYKACKAINFTGNQGVIVPERNIKNISLPDEIINDIADGSFHIYPVSTVDDSMEILTGKEAGKRNSRGLFPHGSFNLLVEKNLKKLAGQAKNFGN
ncbi:MAG: AAA family ATPase [Spirochaetales bacterium]|uniref:endopeptidase La n=1 Tax=Candidatus Thalassospirochaeta sargassi TaxID=3119039 RepID=A0AAJ1IEP6_9SPIO|nr:AAA family ATPase [Spirochaetales bacterium]